jgi:aspartyl-tRNA(Asn)/glutamyl-tRNA(Gln) amidotransferase subunit A
VSESLLSATGSAGIARILERLGRRELTASDLTNAVLDDIEARAAGLNCFISVLADEARAQARKLDETLASHGRLLPLHGIPISLKDNIAIRGRRTTAGSQLLKDWLPEEDASVVARLRRAGAVLIGKTNLHELAFGAADAGFGEVCNPVDARYSCSGSSSGSAAAVGAGFGLGSIATDTGGSIRVPAALCGVVGLKPTTGLIGRSGVVPVSSSLDHVGPLARSVEDVAFILNAVVGYDSGDSRSRLQPEVDHRAEIDRGMADLEIGVLDDRDVGAVSSEIRDAMTATRQTIAEEARRVRSIRLPEVRVALETMLSIAHAECYEYHADAFRRASGSFGAVARERLADAQTIAAADYIRAQRTREQLTRRVDEALKSVDVLLLPATATTAYRRGTTEIRVQGGKAESASRAMSHFTPLFNLTGHPALVLPVAVTAQGLPVSMQLVARHFAEDTLLRVGRSLELHLSLRHLSRPGQPAATGGAMTSSACGPSPTLVHPSHCARSRTRSRDTSREGWYSR